MVCSGTSISGTSESTTGRPWDWSGSVVTGWQPVSSSSASTKISVLYFMGVSSSYAKLGNAFIITDDLEQEKVYVTKKKKQDGAKEIE